MKMTDPSPTHRINAIEQMDPKGLRMTVAADPIEDAIARNFHFNDKAVPVEVAYAVGIWLSDYKRTVLDAFLLAGASVEEIYNALEIPLNVTRLYMRYFFDRTAFRDRLDLENYVRVRIENAESDAFACMVLRAALDSGKIYLLAKFGRDKYAVPMKHALEDVFQNMYCKHAELKGAGPTQDGSKEQRSFVRALLQTADAMPTVSEFEESDKTGVAITIKKRVAEVRAARGQQEQSSQEPLDVDIEIVT